MNDAFFLPILALSLVLTALSSAHAQLAITNGDFENPPAGNAQTNVTDWFDYDGSGLAWWQQTSSDANPSISPFPGASSYLFLSGATNFNYWAYQSIGTNSDGLDTVSIQFDAGTLVDAQGNLNRTITFSLYQSDGTFEGAQNVDIDGATGVTLVDSFDATTGPLTPGQTVTLSGELDLSSTDTTSELFLRVSNSQVDGGSHYTGIDNIIILDPERFSIVEHPVSVIVWTGEQVIFNLAVDSDLPYDVQWEISTDSGESWTPIDGATSESYVIAAADVSDDRNQYRAVAIQDDTTLFTDAAVLRVGDPDAPTPQNVVAHYRFEGTDGGAVSGAVDSSGNGHDLGEPIGDPSYSSSVASSRLHQTGEDNDTSLNLTGGQYAIQGTDGDSLSQVEWDDFTIEAWVNFASIAGWQTIVGRDDRGNQNSDGEALVYFQKTTGNLFRFVGWGINGERHVVLSNFSFTPDTWTHVAAVADTESGTITLYANGNPVGSTGGYQGLLRANPNTHWTIGRGQFGGDAGQTDWVNGHIDEVRFSSAALSPSEFLNASNAVLNFALHPADIETLAGSSVQFDAAAGGGGTGELTYQWQVSEDGGESWTDVPDATEASFSIEFALVAQDGNQYRVIASRDGNDEPSAPATLTVPGYPEPNIVQGLGAGQLAFSGEAFSFEVEATGIGNVTYQWQHDGVDMEGQTGPVLDLGGVGLDTAGPYSVIVSDDAATDEQLDPVSVTLSTVLTVVNRPSGAISLNFVGASSSGGNNPAWVREFGRIAPDEAAGVVPVANWNNSPDGRIATMETPMALVDDIGDPTSAAATWASANAWGIRTGFGSLAEKDADQRLFHGYIEGRAGSTVTITDIPYDTYDVYVYPVGVEGAHAAFIRSITLESGEAETTLFGRNYGGTTILPPVPFHLATATTLEEAEASSETATVFRFPEVSGSSVTINHADVVGGNLGGIGGISIVNTTEGVPSRPVLATRPSGTFMPAGGAATLSVAAESVNAGGSLSYQWQKDGVDISGATETTLTIDESSSGDTGNYTVIVSETSDLGSSLNQTSAPVVIVDSARPALISADLNWGTHAHMSGHGSLRSDGSLSMEDIGEGDTQWKRMGEGLPASIYSTFTDAEGMGLSGLTFNITGATGINNSPGGGGIDLPIEDWSGPLLRDYVFTQGDNEMQMELSGLQAFAGREVTLVVYAVGQNSTSWPDSDDEPVDTNDVATVTLAAQNSPTGQSQSGVTDQEEGRELRYNDQAYVSFDAVVAVNGTLRWSVGPVPDEPGVNAFNGFQLLVTDAGDGEPPLSPLQAWRAEHFGTTDDTGAAALTADPDGDGRNNLIEYALGTNPMIPGDGHDAVRTGETGGFLTLTFRHIDDPSIVYEIQATNDLDEEWTVVHTYDPFTTIGEETYTDDVSADGAERRFLRLRIMLIQ